VTIPDSTKEKTVFFHPSGKFKWEGGRLWRKRHPRFKNLPWTAINFIPRKGRGKYCSVPLVDEKTTTMYHRLVWECANERMIPEGMQIDHIDRNPLNNDPSNLRICTRSENQANTNRSSGASRWRGVTWNPRTRKWNVKPKLGPKRHWLGAYHEEEEAAMVANLFWLQNIKDFAAFNNHPNNLLIQPAPEEDTI
jgi:hypothetical protein